MSLFQAVGNRGKKTLSSNSGGAYTPIENTKYENTGQVSPYNFNLPCLNPNCKSHGVPHPNCRCYGHATMAKGGEIDHFCSKARTHNKECEYYADGGGVDDLPPGYTVDSGAQPSAPAPQQSLDELPQGYTVDNQGDEPPSGYTVDGPEEPEDAWKAAALGAVSGLISAPATNYIATKVLGVNPNDIARYQSEHPAIYAGSEAAGLTVGALSGMGEAAWASKAAGMVLPEAISVFGKLGVAAMKGAIESGIIQGGDEISNQLITGQGDPQDPVGARLLHSGANILYAAGTGAGVGGVFNALGQGVSGAARALEDANIGTKIHDFMHGIGAASSGITPGDYADAMWDNYGVDPKIATAGMEFYNNGIKDLSRTVVASGVGYTLGGIPGAIAGGSVASTLGKGIVDTLVGTPINKAAKKYVLPTLYRLMTSVHSNGYLDTLNNAKQIGTGVNSMLDGIESLFKSGGQQAINLSESDSDRIKLRKFLDDNGLNQQMQNTINEQPKATQYAEGGVVEKPVESQADGMAMHFPEQNMVLQSAKGRISNYLRSILPSQVQNKMPFDEDLSHKDQERKLDRAMGIAIKPLSILNKIKSGTITVEDMGHFRSMFPESYNLMSKYMTKRITEAQVNEEKPTYRVRQGMSLFLGSPLDSTFKQPNMLAAQSTFMNAAPQLPPAATQKKPKRNTSKIGEISEQYKTGEQAAASRQIQSG